MQIHEAVIPAASAWARKKKPKVAHNAITGNDIQPWSEQTMDDIIINNPTEQSNNENT